MVKLFSRSLLLASVAMLVPGGAAQAETLQGALARAYENNPTLTAARAGQRALDENEPITRADGLPGVGTQLSYQETIDGQSQGGNRFASGGINLSVPIYQGGQVRNSLRATRQRIAAGRADLRSTEATVFSRVVAAYMDVTRDAAIVALNRNNVAVLTTNLRATRDRFEIGDLTRTDVAQSEARLAQAEGRLRGAEASLIGSRETYIQLVGEAPADLAPPPMLPNLPASVEDAVAVALTSNPDLEGAARDVDASRFDIATARGSRLPRVSATANSGYTDFLGSANSVIPGARVDQGFANTTAGVTVSLPLFQGGRPAALVRQAQARSSQALEGQIAVERNVIAQTRALYASWQASQEVIRASREAVSANALSLEGVRAENSVGTRTILDILNAEQELLDSQVQLVTAERDSYVAGFSLLAAMGRAEARDLGLEGGALYDPVANYDRVRGEIWDWSDDPAPQTVSTTTRGVPAQDASAPDIARPVAPR